MCLCVKQLILRLVTICNCVLCLYLSRSHSLYFLGSLLTMTFSHGLCYYCHHHHFILEQNPIGSTFVIVWFGRSHPKLNWNIESCHNFTPCCCCCSLFCKPIECPFPLSYSSIIRLMMMMMMMIYSCRHRLVHCLPQFESNLWLLSLSSFLLLFLSIWIVTKRKIGLPILFPFVHIWTYG